MKIDDQESCEYRSSSILLVSLVSFQFSAKTKNGQEICFVH